MRLFKEISEYCSVKIHGMEIFKNRLGKVIITNIHNMCFSDQILFLQVWFKVTQHWDF